MPRKIETIKIAKFVGIQDKPEMIEWEGITTDIPEPPDKHL